MRPRAQKKNPASGGIRGILFSATKKALPVRHNFIDHETPMCVGRSTMGQTDERRYIGHGLLGTFSGNQMGAADGGNFSYIINTSDIIKELRHSKEHGNVIGICAISLGPNMVMTAVEDIIDIKNDLLVILKETDLLGMKVPEEQIMLSEIVRVHPFRTLFDDPFHVQLRASKAGNQPTSPSAPELA